MRGIRKKQESLKIQPNSSREPGDKRGHLPQTILWLVAKSISHHRSETPLGNGGIDWPQVLRLLNGKGDEGDEGDEGGEVTKVTRVVRSLCRSLDVKVT